MTDYDALLARALAIVEAAEQLPAAERVNFVHERCGDDEPLLRACLGLIAKMAPEDVDFSGRVIGPYDVHARIGIGGSSQVYLAARRGAPGVVAIKFLRPGSGSAKALRRFRLERHILATLEHEHIVRFLDHGETKEGWPYLVMQHVEGCDILRYCNRQELSSVRRRLELFLQLVDAVAYAHRLYVHRDLKPANVFVTYDAGRVRVLDFGIAKVRHAELVDHVGSEPPAAVQPLTQEYASPEQLADENTTTSSDIYQLGVILFELLAGRRPFLKEGQSREQYLQAVRFEEPPAPSAVATDDAARACQLHHVRRLRHILRGDLDSIVLKAISTRPNDRYPSATALADDVRRYLNTEPVFARGGGPFYRWSRALSRHRAVAAAAVLVILSLAAGAAGMAWQSRRARAEAAKATAVKNFLLRVFTTTEMSGGNAEVAQQTTARQLLERGGESLLADRALPPDVRLELLTLLGELHSNLRLNEAADRLQNEAIRVARESLGPDHPSVAYALVERALTLGAHGKFAESDKALHEAISILERTNQIACDSYPAALYQLGFNAYQRGEYQQALASLQLSVSTYVADYPQEALRQTAHRWLGQVYSRLERFVDAEREYRQALQVSNTLYGPTDYRSGTAHYVLGELYQRLDRVEAAEPELHQACETLTRAIGSDHPNTSDCRLMLGRVRHRLGRRAEGRVLMTAALDAATRRSANPNAVERAQLWLAASSLDEGDLTSALEHVRALLTRWGSRPPTLFLATALHTYGVILSARGEHAEAEQALERALAIRRTHLGETAESYRETLAARGALWLARGDAQQADNLLQVARRSTAGTSGLVEWQATLDLARVRLAVDDWRSALELAREVIAGVRAGASTRHRELGARARVCEGLALRALGQPDAAHDTLEAAVQALSSVHIPASPWLLEARAALKASPRQQVRVAANSSRLP
jgi:eukaryotic-like serine/threonine-protein kinase